MLNQNTRSGLNLSNSLDTDSERHKGMWQDVNVGQRTGSERSRYGRPGRGVGIGNRFIKTGGRVRIGSLE